MTGSPDPGPVAYFHGHQPRECGEHRTVGTHRAWCYQCQEWCYPSTSEGLPCRGCELPMLRARIRGLETSRRLEEPS